VDQSGRPARAHAHEQRLVREPPGCGKESPDPPGRRHRDVRGRGHVASWLALSDTGLTTHGNSASAAAHRKESAEAPAGTIRNAGCAAAASATAAARPCPRRRSPPALGCAAASPVRSPTTTPWWRATRVASVTAAARTPPKTWRPSIKPTTCTACCPRSARAGLLFGSSAGAVVGLALVTAHPARLRTLVAHEPPLVELLPDSTQGRARFADVYDIYRSGGAGKAMGKFMVHAAWTMDPGGRRTHRAGSLLRSSGPGCAPPPKCSSSTWSADHALPARHRGAAGAPAANVRPATATSPRMHRCAAHPRAARVSTAREGAL